MSKNNKEMMKLIIISWKEYIIYIGHKSAKNTISLFQKHILNIQYSKTIFFGIVITKNNNEKECSLVQYMEIDSLKLRL